MSNIKTCVTCGHPYADESDVGLTLDHRCLDCSELEFKMREGKDGECVQDVCDDCSSPMLVWKPAITDKTVIGFCNKCTNEPVTLGPIDTDTNHHIVGLAIL